MRNTIWNRKIVTSNTGSSANNSIFISYVCLIYKSTKWLQFVKDQLLKFTNMNNNEFFFVANDATPEVKEYLKVNNIPHFIHENSEEQRKEWYINNVYRAWNCGARNAKGKYIIFINSDMAFSPNWADKLINSIQDDKVITSRLVERGVMTSGTYGIERHFGNNPSDYNEQAFLNYAQTVQVKEIKPGGLYMPLIIKKADMNNVGYFPEGNIVPDSDIFSPTYAKLGEACIPGDVTFMKKLKTMGINHYTNFDSIVYHFQEGETRDS